MNGLNVNEQEDTLSADEDVLQETSHTNSGRTIRRKRSSLQDLERVDETDINSQR